MVASKFHPTILKTNFPILAASDDFDMQEDDSGNEDSVQCSQTNVPKPSQASVNKFGGRKNMTKLPKNISQKLRFTCDADVMKTKKV